MASVGADKLGLGESVSRWLTHVADKLVLELAGNLGPLHTELLGLPESMAPGIQGHKAGMRDFLMIWSQESHSITSFVLCWLHGHKGLPVFKGMDRSPYHSCVPRSHPRRVGGTGAIIVTILEI